MAELGKAYLEVMPSAKGLKGKLSESLGGDMPAAGKQAGQSFGNGMIGKIKGMIAVAGIGAAIAKSISAGAFRSVPSTPTTHTRLLR